MGLGIELADCVLSYDLRHAGILAPAPVLAMLLADAGNPRSMIYQCMALRSCLERLGADDDAEAVGQLQQEAVNLSGRNAGFSEPLSSIARAAAAALRPRAPALLHAAARGPSARR